MSIAQGGSTITQQLAKMLFSNRRGAYEEVKEAAISIQIERRLPRMNSRTVSEPGVTLVQGHME